MGNLSTHGCRDRPDATRQFVSFLRALKRGDALGGDVYHALPQALKLDHVPYGLRGRSHGYDALGRVETLGADLAAMRSSLGLPPLDLSAMAVLESRRHSHRHQACASVDRNDPKLCALVRELYRADYVCFGGDEGGMGARC